MTTYIKNILLKLLISSPILSRIYYRKRFYGLEAEDAILNVLFETKEDKGFYVDIGSHHPYRFSNTALFYQRGWNGINIDGDKKLIDFFNKIRKRDINLNLVIANKAYSHFYIFDDPALNTLSKERAECIEANTSFKVKQKIELRTCTLEEVLKKYLPQNQKIDFLNIDVESIDIEVLESNDWNTYRPQIILIEDFVPLSTLSQSNIHEFLTKNNYTIVARTPRTSFYQDKLNEVSTR